MKRTNELVNRPGKKDKHPIQKLKRTKRTCWQ